MDELRKAAGTAVDVWDDTGTRHEDVVNAMNDLRKVLAKKNASAAPQDQVLKTLPHHKVDRIMYAEPDSWDAIIDNAMKEQSHE